MININNNTFTIENDRMRREIIFCPTDGLYTTALINKSTGTNMAKKSPGHEFMIRVNDEMLYGHQVPAVHEVDGSMVEKNFPIEFVNASKEIDGDKETLLINLSTKRHGLKITCYYQIISKNSGINKWLKISSTEAVYLTQFNFEVINAYPGKITDIKMSLDQLQPHHSPYFSINGNHDSLCYFNIKLNESLVVTSNVPPKLRRFLSFPSWTDTALMVGLNPELNSGIELEPNTPYTSYSATVCSMAGSLESTNNANQWRDIIRDQLPCLPHKEGFMYCTWLPFLKNIDEELLINLIDEAADMGMKYFVIDDGWFVAPDWKVDKTKFPNGLEPIMDHIRQRNMLVGLWFNIGTDYGDENTHNETYCLDARNKYSPLGFSGSRYTRCMASVHRDRMAEKLISLAKQYGIDYFKLDFSSISSPYGILPFGCNATNHDYHKHNGDSMGAQYAGLFALRNIVKTEFPNLILDFSFECFGHDEPSLSALQACEINHTSNLSTNNDTIDARLIRQAIYRYCAQMPAERILGSLICIQGDDIEKNIEYVLSAVTGAPLIAGDLINLAPGVKSAVKETIALINTLFDTGHLTEYEVLNDSLNCEQERWDGFARYTKQGKGIICIFRNQDPAISTTIRCSNWPEGTYTITRFNKPFKTLNHQELAAGFDLPWNDQRSILLLVN